MTESGSRKCPRCGATLSADVPANLCTRCALADAFAAGRDEIGARELALHDIPVPGQAISYIGDYELLEIIARGGMGVVYKARQMNLNRLVALKMLLGGSHASEEYKSRFRQEAKAAAKLNHANIVPIYEVGEHEGQLYFAMEYVAGSDLAGLVRGQPLPPERASRYVKTVAEAVQYAHDQGILHRDLKPSNILIGSDDRPRVTDFGLAKQVEVESSLTTTGQPLGSPGYIPPEQISIQHGSVGPQSDVYSMGAVLYHLLTGRPPLLAGTLADTLRQVLEVEPVSPRQLNPAVPPDLATICLKCLDKNPARRYATAKELADELERFLTGRPILARPVSATGRLWRWCRRNPMMAGLTGLVLVSLLGGLSGVLWQWSRAEQANRELKAALLRAKVATAEDRLWRGEPRNAVARLAQVLRDDPAQPVAGARLLAALTWRNWPLPLRQAGPASSNITLIRFSPQKQFIAAISMDGSLWIWDGQSRAIGDSWPQGKTNWLYVGLAFGSDEKMLYALTSDGRLLAGDPQGIPQFSRGSTNEPLVSAALLSAGKILAGVSSKHVLTAWTWPDGNVKYTVPDDLPLLMPVFSVSGNWLATVSSNHMIRVWDASIGHQAGPAISPEGIPAMLGFSPKADQLVVCNDKNDAALWDWRNGRRLMAVHSESPIESVQFSSTGSRIALFSRDGLSLWETETGKLLFERRNHCNIVGDGGPFPEDRLAVLETGRTVLILNPQTGDPVMEWIRSSWPVDGLDVSSDGRELITAPWEKTGTIWDTEAGAAHCRELPHEADAGSIAFSPDGRTFATGGRDVATRLWDTRTWRPIGTLVNQSGDVALNFSPDGRLLASGSTNATATIREVATGKQVAGPLKHHDAVVCLAFSPDGSRLATATDSGVLQFWDPRSGQSLTPPCDVNPAGDVPWNQRNIHGIEFSADGKRLAAACGNSTAQIWDSTSGRRLQLLPHSAPVVAARFIGDGKRLATACMGGTAQIWDSNTGRPLTTELHHPGGMISMSVNSQSDKMVAGGTDGGIRVWSTTGAMLAETESVPGYTWAVALSHSGESFAAAVGSNHLRVWETSAGVPLTDWHIGLLNQPNRLLFSPDDHWVAAAGFDHRVALIPQYQPSGPAPDWLPELAEAVAGEKLRPDGIVEPVPPEAFIALKQRLESIAADDFYSRWVKWFLADRRKRDPFPQIN
jgi:WD40 repeat protein